MGFLINVIVSLIVGGVCGWLASMIMKTGGSLLYNVILGIIGGVVGGVIFSLIGLAVNGIIGSIICGVVGSCLVIWIVKMIQK